MTYLDLKNLQQKTNVACIVPGFPGSLLSINNLCDAGLHCTFTHTSVHAFDPKTSAVKLQGWRDLTSRLWSFPTRDIMHDQVTPKQNFFHQGLTVNSACDLTSVLSFIKYHHATAGFPVKET